MNERLRRPTVAPEQGDVVWSAALLYPIVLMALGGAATLVSSLLGAVLLLIGFAWLAYRSVPVALAAYIVMAPIPLKIVVHSHKLFVSDAMAIILLAVVLWVIRGQTQREGQKFGQTVWDTFFPSAYRWPLVLLLGLSVLSLGVALSHSGTVIKLLEYFEFFVVVVGIARFTGRSQSVWKLYLYALLAIAVVASAIGLSQFLVGAGPISNQIAIFHVRASSIFGQPNPFGGFEADIFPLIAAMIVLGPKDLPKRWMTVGLFFVAAGIVASYSRGAWVADIMAVLIMGLVAYSTRGKRVLMPLLEYAVLIPVVLFVVVDLVGKVDLKPIYHHLVGHSKPLAIAGHAGRTAVHAVVKVTSPAKKAHSGGTTILAHANTGSKIRSLIGVLLHPRKYYDVQQRLIIWNSALHAFLRHPLLGVGLGNFHLYIAAHKPKNLVGGIPPMAHDLYLEWGADLGIGGVIAAIWLEWRWVATSLKAIHHHVKELDTFWYAAAVGAFGTVVAFMVQNLVDFLIDHGVIVPFLLALAIITLALPQRSATKE